MVARLSSRATFLPGGKQMHTLDGLHQDRFHRHLNDDRYQLPFQRWHSADGQRFQRRSLVYLWGPARGGLHPVVPDGFIRTVYRPRQRLFRSSNSKRRNDNLHQRTVDSAGYAPTNWLWKLVRTHFKEYCDGEGRTDRIGTMEMHPPCATHLVGVNSRLLSSFLHGRSQRAASRLLARDLASRTQVLSNV